MKLDKWIITSLGIVFVLLIILGYSSWPAVSKIYSEYEAQEIVYKTREAYSNDYKLHTTPLSQNIVEDLCLNLEIEAQNESCKPGAVVYAPELFDELKAYFQNLPDQDKTYTTVQNKLGTYLVFCSQPDSEGDFRCKYDFRGDSVYRVLFDFNKEGFYWQIIANIGGS